MIGRRDNGIELQVRFPPIETIRLKLSPFPLYFTEYALVSHPSQNKEKYEDLVLPFTSDTH